MGLQWSVDGLSCAPWGKPALLSGQHPDCGDTHGCSPELSTSQAFATFLGVGTAGLEFIAQRNQGPKAEVAPTLQQL